MLAVMLAILMALLMSGCGAHKKLSDEKLQEKLSDFYTPAGQGSEITELQSVSHKIDGNNDTVTLTIIGQNEFTDYTQQGTLTLYYSEDRKDWLCDKIEITSNEISPHTSLTAATAAECIDDSMYEQMGIGADSGVEDSLQLYPDFAITDQNMRASAEDGGYYADLTLDFGGQSYGWFDFSGTALATLRYDDKTGEWHGDAMAAQPDFDVTCRLSGHSYESLHNIEWYFSHTHVWNVYSFGDFDWKTGTFSECSYTYYSDGGEENGEEAVDHFEGDVWYMATGWDSSNTIKVGSISLPEGTHYSIYTVYFDSDHSTYLKGTHRDNFIQLVMQIPFDNADPVTYLTDNIDCDISKSFTTLS